jgi:hypothetical protein
MAQESGLTPALSGLGIGIGIVSLCLCSHLIGNDDSGFGRWPCHWTTALWAEAYSSSHALLVLATVVTQGLKTRPGGAEISVALGVAAAYLLVFVRMAIPTERSHLVEYGVVALFIYEALLERASQGRRVPVPALRDVKRLVRAAGCVPIFHH